MLTSFYENKLIDALQPIRFYSLAINLYHLFETGIYDILAKGEGVSIAVLAEQRNLDVDRIEVFLKYLRNEGILVEADGLFTISEKGKAYGEFRAWYTLLMGGYASTLVQLGDKLPLGSGEATRNAGKVGAGSCEINRIDTMPLIRDLMQLVPGGCSRLLDMGCGNGRYLVDFCQAMPEIEFALGVEPSEDGCQEAKALVAQHGLQDKIQILCKSASEFLNSGADYEPDFIVLGFILHEILGQEGEAGVVQFLTQLFERFPELYMIVMEVDNQIDEPRLMQHGLSLAFFNIYYLFHPFTGQRLETFAFWEAIFAKCQLEIVAQKPINFLADSTGLVQGYLLKKCQSTLVR